MNREELFGIEQSADRARRVFAAPFEIRAADGGSGLLTFDGYASTTETEYPVYGGHWPGWLETVGAGAFKRTLKNNADVAFLINHGGMTLARTKSGTLKLSEDDTGLRVVADLDPRQQPVADLHVASERGDIDEMSFAFRVIADEWTDDNGEPSNWSDGTRRRITEVSLHKGDVSAVNYGANDTTSGGFRELESAFAELRAGRTVSAEARARLRAFVDGLDPDPDPEPEPEFDVRVLEAFARNLAYAHQ